MECIVLLLDIHLFTEQEQAILTGLICGLFKITPNGSRLCVFQGVYKILKPSQLDGVRIGACDSPAKAYEAVIEYVLKKLI